MILLGILVSLVACGGGDHGPTPCANTTVCTLFPGGQCLPSPAGVDLCAYPSPECPSGLSWSPLTGDLAGECVAEDAPLVDASPGATSFAVGFVSSWMIGSDAISLSNAQWVRVANKGAQPLDLSGARIVNVVSNAPGVIVTAEWNPVTTVLEPERSAGALSAAASSLIVGGGFVNEPAQTTSDDLVTLSARFPQAWTLVDVEITIEINDARSTLPVRLYKGGPGTGSFYAVDSAMKAVSVAR
jgi:hypothetical protein